MKRNILLGIALLALITTACRGPLTHKKEQGGPEVPHIAAQLQGATYAKDSAPQALTIRVSAGDGGTLSFQWYSNTVDSNEGGTEISGETGESFMPPTDTLGITYYYVVVTNTLNRRTAEIASNAVRIVINNKINADIPFISAQPLDGAYSLGEAATALTVEVSIDDNGDLSFQWYSNTENSNEGGTEILGATEESYVPPTIVTGKTYYYVVVTNTIADNDDGGNKTARTISETAEIRVGVMFLTITGLSAENKVYDGTTDAAVIGTAVLTGPLEGHDVSIVQGTASFEDKNAGTDKIVTFSGWALAGEDADNYVLSAQPESVTADIEAKSVTITGLSAETKQYDGTTSATVIGTAVLEGVLEIDDVGLTAGTAAFADKNVGTNKIVTFSGYSLEGEDADNYSLSQPGSVSADIEFVSMVQIPGGTFEMGKDLGSAATGDVTPLHNVTLSGFYMAKYQVTQSQYQTVMGSLPSSLTSGTNYGRGDDYPVYYVSWYDALVFCNKLSMLESLSPAYRISGSTDPTVWGTVPTSSNETWNAVEIVVGSTGYRLPTEAQWEYAAKGGDPSAIGWVGYTYSGSDTVGDVAWYSGNNGSSGTPTYGTKAVGTKAANRLGIYDMSGNVWEWCWDRYGEYTSGAQTDPTGAAAVSSRVGRGGCWGNNASSTRSAIRLNYNPNYRFYDLGFRLVRP